ncbi:hypothetical protein D3C87_1220960 [compost metagenome]
MVDTTPPAKPTIARVVDDVGSIQGDLVHGGTTDDFKPWFKGTAEADSTVIIRDGATEIGRVQANAAGEWTFVPLTNLSNGPHSITATAVDKAGNTSVVSDAFGFTVDTLAPAKPTIASVVDDVGSIVGNVALNGTTDDARPDFKGKAEANSTVVVFDKGVMLAQVQADASGNWSWTPATALGNGVHTITVTAVDKAGNASVASDAFGFTVATTPPGKPTIVSVIDDVEAITGAIANGTTTNDAKPTFSGKADANGTVIIYDKGVEIDRVQANASGNWTYTPAKALGEGAHSITVAGADPTGNTSAQSDAFGFTVDTTPPSFGPEGGAFLTYSHIWYEWWVDLRLPTDGSVRVGDIAVVKSTFTGETYYFDVKQAHVDKGILQYPVPSNGQLGYFMQLAWADSAGNMTAFTAPIPLNANGTQQSGWFYPPKTLGVADAASIVEDNIIDSPAQVYIESDETFIARLGVADRIEGGAGNDTFTKVGTGDTVHGGAGDDVIRVNSGDFAHIDGGLGVDTLVMDGKAMHIDLSALGLKVQGVEKFDLGAGGNTLALSTHDVLAGGARDMVMADGKVQMLVNGANGEVDLRGGTHGDDGWTQGSNATVGGVTYSVYTNLAGTAELLVEDKVHVTIL